MVLPSNGKVISPSNLFEMDFSVILPLSQFLKKLDNNIVEEKIVKFNIRVQLNNKLTSLNGRQRPLNLQK